MVLQLLVCDKEFTEALVLVAVVLNCNYNRMIHISRVYTILQLPIRSIWSNQSVTATGHLVHDLLERKVRYTQLYRE